MRAPRGNEGGFTLIELMVAMTVFVIGLLGVVALHATAVKALRMSRGLDRARVLAGQVMEDLRAHDLTALPTAPLADVVTPDGVTYRRAFSVTPVSGAPTLVLLTATATFDDEVDGQDHVATVRLLRTTMERL